MARFTSGRATASSYAYWALANLLVAGPALGLLSAYDAASDGTLQLQYPIFNTHCWITLMGWCVPIICGLVYWLFPILKEKGLAGSSLPRVALLFLVLPTIGLGAYLFLSHLGYSSLFIQPVVWGLYLVAAVLYGMIVWRLTARTLRPSGTDMGVQAGAVWLLVVIGVRIIVALGSVTTNRSEFLASSDAAIAFAMLFGFMGNTVLALSVAVAPPFLGLSAPRPTIVTAFRWYNGLLGVWCGGAAWILPYPSSLGRLLLAGVGFGFAYSVINLLTHLRLTELLLLRAYGARRLLARTTFASGAITMLVAAVTVAVVGTWSAATMQAPPADLISLAMHLLTVGVFASLVLALFVPVTGSRSLAGVRGVLAWGAYLLLTLWLIAKIGLTVISIVTGQTLWAERYAVGWLVGLGMLMLSLWLVSALSSRPAATDGG